MKVKIVLMIVLMMVPGIFAQETAHEKYLDYFQKGVKAFQAKDYETALDNFKLQLTLSPYRGRTYMIIAHMHILMGNEKEALDCLEKALVKGYDYGDELAPELKPLSKKPENKKIRKLIEKMKTPVNRSSVAFTLPEKDLIPEGITYDPVDGSFYIGSIYKCKIVKYDKNGKVSDFTTEKQDGLDKVLGMKVDVKRRILWVASEVGDVAPSGTDPGLVGWSGLFKYDLATGKLIKKYTIHEKGIVHIFNDVALSSNGDVYISDTEYGAVYVVRKDRDKIELFIKGMDFIYPNGIDISPDDKYLYLASSGDGIYRIDIATKKYVRLTQPDEIDTSGLDGMYLYKNSLVCVQNGGGLKRVSRIYLNADGDRAERIEVIETRNPHFAIPTTGVIVNDVFYYVANAQMGSLKPDGTLLNKDKLKEPVILKVKLK